MGRETRGETNQRDRRKSYHREFTTPSPNDIDRLVFHGRATPSVHLVVSPRTDRDKGSREGNSPVNSSVRHTSSITTNSEERSPVYLSLGFVFATRRFSERQHASIAQVTTTGNGVKRARAIEREREEEEEGRGWRRKERAKIRRENPERPRRRRRITGVEEMERR